MKAQASPDMALNGKKCPYKSLHNLRIASLLLQGTQYFLSGGRNSTFTHDYFEGGLPTKLWAYSVVGILFFYLVRTIYSYFA
ncbi:hypothetical protein VN23_03995 [Janthinobacterium sp. B9-8]|nr:hypothetical protein VN23_03995 [Janthinobacterium sp. B9-8]